MHKFLRHAEFFLTLIARSMSQHILESGRIKVVFFLFFILLFYRRLYVLISFLDAATGKISAVISKECGVPFGNHFPSYSTQIQGSS